MHIDEHLMVTLLWFYAYINTLTFRFDFGGGSNSGDVLEHVHSSRPIWHAIWKKKHKISTQKRI